ncbi:hypothetical protein [Streptomyces sp. NPDC057582]|uniref:hypothetical protein n=1 Tax=unclassified Streptomyces TaxID=2593676 RepID=UPI0036CF1B80
MPVAPACAIAPPASQREQLKKMAYGHKTEYQLRMRAQVVLHAARGAARMRASPARRVAARNSALAAELPSPILVGLTGVHRHTAIRWVTYARLGWAEYLAARAEDDAEKRTGTAEIRSSADR